MSDGWTTKRVAAKHLLNKAERIKRAPVFGAIVSVKSTSGILRRVRSADDKESRSVGQNITILRDQAKKGRNILFLSAQERAQGTFMWAKGTSAFLQNQRGTELEGAAQRVSELLVKAYQRHIERSETKRGKMRPVKPGTQKRKDREGIRPGLPPLIRTGQLSRSLTGFVRRRR